jgi:diadenosine tetraphosphate (Ap4A) HIT family hydrolase
MFNENKIFGCVFCEPEEHLIVEETKNFFVLKDPFPLTDGHIMITTKEHYGCAGEIPQEWLEELNSLCSLYSYKTRDAYGSVSLYEHGRAGVCHAYDADEADPNSCNHFHLHLLPFEHNLRSKLKETYKETIIADFQQLSDEFYRLGNYIFYRNSYGDSHFYAVENKAVPPHLMRTLIAEEIGNPDLADWQKIESKIARPHISKKAIRA